ncbi:hypothetical protein [Anaeromyxobacter sp. Fw109-5]|uniref:hypothetical protein n=1 Tax=Anaeromyxobacter sp. (strain Fw109-5) TaxID=404589 RepID=UPI0000ED800B|nr:hypothetical protein [Anaeromyxobacter sp. Fw109-5]ABS25240.1 conserved hypothetical protein [Anaeromyxobacter sp. Fw109-5]
MTALAFLLTAIVPLAGTPAQIPAAASPAAGQTGAQGAAGPSGDAGGCALSTLAADAALVADCVSCHGAGHAGTSSHPVGADYGAAAARGGSLRPAVEVVRRGVFLPDGRVQCVTCHDPRSPWADHLALPPGATPKRAVNPADRATFEAEGEPQAAPPPGTRVTPKPLCLACHAFD